MTPSATIESILVPTDTEGRLAGDERYVTPRLLAELLRREARHEAGGGWVASSPRYTGRLDDETEAATGPSFAWEMAFDLEVFGGDRTIELPLRAADAAWAKEVLLDGISAPLVWDADGTTAGFQVPRLGRYRVRLGFSPTTEELEDRKTLSLTLPPMPGAELRLRGLGAVNDMQVNGRMVGSSSSESVILPLDGSPRMTITWRTAVADERTVAASAELWEWLEVGREQAQLDVVFRLADVAGQPDRLEVLAGDRLLDSDAAETPRGWRVESPPRIETATDGAILVRVRLQRTRPDTYGRLRLPQLRLRGAATVDRHLALAHAADLTVVVSGAAANESDVLNDAFRAYWPERNPPSLVATVNPQGRSPVTTVRPTPATSVPDESLDVCCLDGRMEILYRGGFSAGNRETFVQQLSVSPDLRIDEVELAIDGQPQPIEFSRPEPNRLMVFLGQPTTASHDLTVRGWVATDDVRLTGTAVTANLPRVTAAGSSAMPQQVSLFAADHLSVEVVEADIMPQLMETPTEPLGVWRAYGISTFLVSPERETPLELRIDSNRPHFEATLLTTVVRPDNTWKAEVIVRVDVRAGLLPAVVLEWPSSFVGEVNVDPPAYLSLEPLGDAPVRHLRIRFPQAIEAGQSIQFVLRSAVRIDSADSVACPAVRMLEADQQQRYFGLLDFLDGKWEYSGATTASVPARLEELPAVAGGG